MNKTIFPEFENEISPLLDEEKTTIQVLLSPCLKEVKVSTPLTKEDVANLLFDGKKALTLPTGSKSFIMFDKSSIAAISVQSNN